MDGHYIHVDAGNGNFLESAILRSPLLPNSSDACEINFYYYMFVGFYI